ncbi:SDR family NAD(P)-dependent oxidoreductase [Actinomycetospora sp. C-140]
MTGRLAGRTALVTGAASGIGAATAAAFTAEGATVVGVDRAEVDVADAASVEALATSVLAEHPVVDVVVNAAGILDETPFLAMDAATFDRTVAVDLRGVFLVSRAFAPAMVARGDGRIVNIASQLGLKGGEGLAHYCAAKAGVLGLTKAMARELAPHGVLVNAVAPGPIETPMVAGLSDAWKVAKRAELPLGRFGVAGEVAPTIVMLAASPDGDLYVGQTLGPNSGDVMP